MDCTDKGVPYMISRQVFIWLLHGDATELHAEASEQSPPLSQGPIIDYIYRATGRKKRL